MKNLLNNLLNWVLKKGSSETKKEQAWEEKEQAGSKKDQVERTKLSEKDQVKRTKLEKMGSEAREVMGSEVEKMRSEAMSVKGSEAMSANHALITQLSRNNHPISLRAIRYAAVLLMVLMVGVGNVWGQTLIYSCGFESGTDSWSKGSMGDAISETTVKRTGGKSLTYTLSNVNGYARKQHTATKNTYIHVIVWARATVDAEVGVKIAGLSESSKTAIGNSGWTRIAQKGNYTSTTGSKNTDFLPHVKSGSWYLDDAVFYYTNTNVNTDLTAPNQPGSASATTSLISWTRSKDLPNSTDSTGVQGTMIWRRTSGSSDDLTLNDQGMYSHTSSKRGPSTDQSGHWTLVDSLGAATTSKAGTFSAGDRYAIVHRDLAYNYSSPTYVTITAAGSTWYVKGGWNSWGTTTNLTGEGTTLTATASLSANTDYEFKIFDSSASGDAQWWGNTGKIGGNISGWVFNSPGSNCHLLTTEAGTYTFSFNTSTKALSVTYPNSYTFYYGNTSSWSKVYVYKFTEIESNSGNAGNWPGTEIASPAYTCGGTNYYAATSDGYATLIFTNNDGSQTGNMAVSSSDAGKYVGGTGNSWSAFPTYTVTYNANGDGAGNATGTTGSVPTDSNSPYACGSTVTVLGNTGSLAKDGYNFIGWNTAPGGGGTSYVADATFTISANTTLYAQWEEEVTYSVTYNLNGGQYNGSGVAPTQAPVESGTGITMPAKVPTKSNYVFGGWTCSIDSKKYAPGQSYTMTAANTTFTAYWIAASSMADGTLYKVEDMIPNTWPLDGSGKMTTTEYGIAGGSANGIFDLLGEGYGNDDTGKATPMGGKKASAAYDGGPSFTNSLYFKGAGAGSPSGSTLPTARAIKFTIPSAGTLTLYVKYPARIKLIKSGGSAEVLGESTSDKQTIEKDVTAGTYYLYATGGSTTLYGLQFDQGCTAPTGLTAASTTAKGTTFTITDGANTNDYEFYVSTSSTAPLAGATATHTSTSKTKTIDDCVAGTTYYAWVRSKCGESNKSGWTALGGGGTFTTSTVGADYHLTNVTKSSGATTGIGGSTFTAVFASVSGYALPSPVVTIDGNAATSGTDYTWTAGTGTLTINADKITGNIDITMSSPAAAPTNVAISGTYHYYPGETISLTATPTGGNGPVTYQWYHGGTADGDAIDGATSATFTKSNCVVGDAGDYYCKVTCGGSASRWSDGATEYTPFKVKIMQFLLKDSNGDDIGDPHALVKGADAQHASLILNLTGGTTYKFRVTDGCGNWYGNSDATGMTSSNCTNWTMPHDADCKMTTGLKTANYTFNFDFTSGLLGSEMKVSIVYPGGNQAADKVIYWDNSVLNWDDGDQWYRIGKSNHHSKTQMTKVSGTANLYKVITAAYDGFEYWHIANNQGNGDGNLFWTKGDADKAITHAMAFEGAPVTLDAITITPTTAHSRGETSDNDNCEFYGYGTASGMKTQNVAISPYSNGTITVNYTNTSNVASTLTSGNADLAHTVILTSITAVPDAGYDASAITINGNAYTANYVVTSATTIAASFTPHVYTITYLDKDGSAFSGSHVDSPNAHPTSHTYATATTLNSATKTGYTFGGWYTSSDCSTGLVTSLGATDYTADITLYAKWTVNTYDVDVTLTDSHATQESGSTGTGVATYGTNYVATFEAVSGYTLPDDVTVTIGGDAATKGTEYTWSVTAGVGTLTITGSYILGNIDITVTAVAAAGDGCWDPENTTAEKLSKGDVSLTTFDNQFSDVAGITSVTIENKSTSEIGGCSGADESTPSGYMKVKNVQSGGTKIITIVTTTAKDITIGGKNYNSNSGSFYLVKSTDTSTKLAQCNTGNEDEATNCPAGTYYIYAKTSSNNVSINFSKLCIADAAPCSTVPTVTAGSNSAVTSTTATVSCASGVSSIGTGACTITSYGFVLNTTGTPTISDTKYPVGTTYTTTGTSFSKDLTGLTASTTYYVRPYATNGYGTGYGTQTSFTTSAPPVLHDVTFSLTNVAYSSGDNQGTGAATEGVEFSTIFAASSGYSLPGTITVTIGGVAQTAGTGYTWAQGSGTLTIPAAYVTDDIVVTIVGEEMEGDGCDELVHTEAATATTLTTTVGSATLTSPNGQTANDKAIKLNSSGYIELSPKAGKSFAAGDSLIIVMWNQASSAKTTGYRIAGTDYTASMPSKVNTTFRRKLIAADIVSSKVKIERESDNGSNAYFVSAIIKHCEDLPSCTTPTLPTLSNQTVCPGSDITAWNAEPTNIATITGASEDVAYSWKKKGSDTELAATASFDLGSSATEGMAGTYVVTVTVSKTGYISKSASAEVDLTVTPATEEPSVSANKATVYAGNSVTLTATCGSSGTITWAWYTCNSDGTGESAIGGATSNSYAIASAPAAGTYYYKVKATGDGTNACGTAEYVYTLTVSEASGTCNMMTIFDGSTMSSAPASTSGTESTSGATWTAVGTATEMSSTVSMEYSGKTYTKGWKFTGGATTSSSRYIQIVIPTGYTGDLVMNGFIGSTSRSVFVATSPTGTLNTSIAYWSPATTNTLATATTRLSAGTYYVCATNSAFLTELSVNVCGDEVCTDEKPTATATNNTVCSGSTLTITATGYESDPTSIQWQKKNGESWDNISGATSATYSVASAAAADAGTYRVQVTKGCTRNSNEVTITIPSAPVFGDVPASVTVMQTIALSISTVEASDAVSYTWYKSADATWDAGDAEICDTKNLLKAYEGEAIGSPSYYVFCRATNSCGTVTSSAIAVNVIAFVSEDCAERGGEGEAQFGFDDGGCGQTSYSETACWTTSTRAKYLTYTAPEGKYLKTAKVTVAVSSGSKCGYAYSTDGGTNWTYAELTSLSSTLTEKTINLNSLSSTINAFRIGRNLQDGSSKDWGVTSGNFYLSKACFEYTESCTATTVTPSGTGSETHTIGDSFTEPTFTVKHGGTAFDPQPEITYTSSNEDIATVDDDGTVNFQGMAGSVTITAAYAGDATYCASEGHYTITVSCSDEAPKIVAASSVDLSGCNSSVTLNAKKQDGLTSFGSGTYQWYRDGEAISGATSASYTAVQAGVYTVERTNSGCTNLSSNSATVTSATVEPEIEHLAPFQYYHVDKTYSAQMKMRHLFTVKGSAAYGSTGKNFKMELSKNSAAATDVTTSNAFVVWQSADKTVDTVMIDLNKLYGKYAENDELVLTCKAVDCKGNVSTIYKDEITIHVIDSTPTLALILNGKDSKVGGDFLEDYEPKNLQEQTGSKTWSGEWPMYTDLKTAYNVTPVNGYAPFNKLNYEPFDIIFLTDFPKASKSDATKTLLDDMYELVDFRPMFSFKTHMLWKSPSKWASKGFTAEPVVPKGGDGRTKMNIVCYAHPMFEAISGSDGTETQRDASDPSQIVYKMLSGVGYENSKGIQGFEIEAAEHFVTIGLIHYNAGSTDGSPSAGQITWSPNAGDRMLVAAAERQANPEARMILLSLNAGAHSKLTAKGRLVVMKSLEYLIQTSGGLIEPADCSYTFDNGEGYSDYNASEYAAAGLHGTKGDGKWSTEANWGPGRNALPGQFTSVRIAAPVTVDMEHAHVMETRIVEGGSIEIPAGKGLEVTSTVRHLDGAEISPTGVSELTLEASTTSNGTLIFNNNSGDSKATVWAYSKGFISEGVKNYQYIGTPFNELNALYNYYGSWIYSWSYNSKKNRWGWVAVKNGGPMHAWTGYCISQESPTYYETSGTMTATGTVDIAVPAGENMVIGNSWTAPIDINALTTDDLEGLVANIYFFNTGVDKEGTAGAAGSRYAGGTYVTVPVEAARYEGEDDHINSMQGFFVKNTSGSDGVLHLDYDRHVRGTTRGSIIGDALHAPARRAALDSNEPEVLKIKVSGENYDDKLLLLAREDFSTGFDNGWDGDKWDGNESSLYIYTTDEEGTENSVSAIPELEGTIIGFRAGEDDAYTLNFEYLNSDEPLYLYDVENNTYTQIMTGMTYRFFTTDNEKHERFIITRSNGQEVPTGVEPVSGSLDRSKAKKLLIEDKMFIIVNGMLYDATGKVVK